MSLPAVFGSDIVTYICSCGCGKSIQWLYFCRHCSASRCRSCCSHEVDSQYCQHCLEYIPTIDGKLKKNRCSICYSCPSCGFTLSSRVSVTPESKSYYLSCLFCRWTTRDSRIPDNTSQNRAWLEPESRDPANPDRIRDLYSHYKSLAMQERVTHAADVRRRMNPLRANHHLHLLDKYGISAGLSPKVSASLREKYYSKQQQQQQTVITASPTSGQLHQVPVSFKADPAIAVAIKEDDEEYEVVSRMYTEPIDPSSMASIDQKFRALELQPDSIRDFRPVSQMLSVKRSLRCKTCDHNLSKPECNPSSIKFKILLSAYYYVPEVRVIEWRTDHVLISLTNPTPYELRVQLERKDGGEGKQDDDDAAAAIVASGARDESVRNFSISFILPAKDETLDIDLELDGERGKKKPSYPSEVVSAKGNKVAIMVPMTEESQAGVSDGGDSRDRDREEEERRTMSLRLTHEFVKALIHVAGSEKREPQIITLTHEILIKQPLPLIHK